MRMIKISEEVWQAIANQGKFGEAEDDVLRRVFRLPASEHNSIKAVTVPTIGRRRTFATQRMTSYISQNQLNIEFQDGASSSWPLPDPKDKMGIRAVLDKAILFARDNGASIGQINAARKTLTNEGYHLTK